MASYTYHCKNEECETALFTFSRPMSEYKDPTNCVECGKSCDRLQNDFCTSFALKGGGWFRDSYGTTDSIGRPLSSKPLSEFSSSSASKTHKK